MGADTGLARCRLAAGDVAGALAAYGRVPVTHRSYADAQIDAALALIGQARFTDASAVLDRLDVDEVRKTRLEVNLLEAAVTAVVGRGGAGRPEDRRAGPKLHRTAAAGRARARLPQAGGPHRRRRRAGPAGRPGQRRPAEDAVVTAAIDLPPCPACGAPHLAEDQFCEACGAPIPGAPTGPASGTAATAVSAPAGALATVCPGCRGTAFGDGYCTVCGMRQPAARDHEERQGAGWAGVSDKGRRHHRNEDAFGVTELPGGRLALVVCDGVSTTHRPDEASAAAVAAALDVLRSRRPPAALAAAGDLNGAKAAAQQAVVTMASDGTPGPSDPAIGPPSCTFLAAVVGDAIELGSLGDCRSYWLDAGGSRQLTSDDSWAGEQVPPAPSPPSRRWPTTGPT